MLKKKVVCFLGLNNVPTVTSLLLLSVVLEAGKYFPELHVLQEFITSDYSVRHS